MCRQEVKRCLHMFAEPFQPLFLRCRLPPGRIPMRRIQSRVGRESGFLALTAKRKTRGCAVSTIKAAARVLRRNDVLLGLLPRLPPKEKAAGVSHKLDSLAKYKLMTKVELNCTICAMQTLCKIVCDKRE